MSRKHSPTDDLQALRSVFGRGLDFTTSERVVLALLLLHRNGKTGRCDPSTYGMADEAGMNRRTVTRAIETLEARGLVECDRRNGMRTTYTLHPPTGDTESPVSESHRCQRVTTPGTQSHRTGDTESPERTKERTKERTDTAAGELWAVFVEEMDGERLTFSRKRRKRLEALHGEQLRHHDDPVGVFRQILRAVQASDHHMSNRDYQMPESLFRNEERRERWTLKALENGKREPETGHGYSVSREELWAEVEGEA